MSLIKILPETLVNQIAAGEVVERPASVVKELVDNSLDAGADRILVEVKDAGKTFVKVLDNGMGMSREDCELALQRHATSKISNEKDLWNIASMGFRGEALASIASVSKLVLKSKREEDLAGCEVQCEGGKLSKISEVGMSKGTQIEVYNLFFNTPARQKYLKKDSTELSKISHLLQSIALANPAVAFKFVHNDKAVFDLAPVTDLVSRVADIFGKATADAMIPVFYGGSDFQVDGFVGKPAISRATGKHQYLFVNGRPIQNHLLAHTIKRAFHSMLMENKRPVYVINLKINPALIDVNVHPRKIEIRFEDEQAILKVFYGMVKTALDKTNLIPKGVTESSRYMSDSFPKDAPVQRPIFDHAAMGGGSSLAGKSAGTSTASSGFVPREAMEFTRQIMQERDTQSLQQLHEDSMSAISQVCNAYIVAQNSEGIVLIDQHAAHERVRYEELMNQFESQEKSVQPLLMPMNLELSRDEIQLLEANLEVFDELGFEIEPFGGDSYVINAVPGFFSKEDIDVVIRGVLDDIANSKGPSRFQGKIEEILTYMSCRSAIKFGQKLSIDEMQSLIKQMDGLERPYTCPHGRPTMVSLDMSELGKMFGRK